MGSDIDSGFGVGPTLGVGAGVGGDLLNGFNPDVRAKAGLAFRGSSESDFSSSSFSGELGAGYSYFYLNPAHRTSLGYNLAMKFGNIVNFSVKNGLFGQWGTIDDNGKKTVTSEGTPTTSDSDYWSIGYMFGLGYNIVSPGPGLPISLNLGGEMLIGGGQKNDKGAFFFGGGAELMFTWYI